MYYDYNYHNQIGKGLTDDKLHTSSAIGAITTLEIYDIRSVLVYGTNKQFNDKSTKIINFQDNSKLIIFMSDNISRKELIKLIKKNNNSDNDKLIERLEISDENKTNFIPFIFFKKIKNKKDNLIKIINHYIDNVTDFTLNSATDKHTKTFKITYVPRFPNHKNDNKDDNEKKKYDKKIEEKVTEKLTLKKGNISFEFESKTINTGVDKKYRYQYIHHSLFSLMESFYPENLMKYLHPFSINQNQHKSLMHRLIK